MNRISPDPPRAPSEWYLRYVLAIAFLVVVVSLMDRYIVSILMEQMKADLALTDTQLGWLVGPAFVVVHVLCQLPLARYADRSVRRDLIAGAMLLWSACTMAAGWTRTFPQLLATRMGVGVTEAACSPPLASMLSDYFPAERRGRAMSVFSVGATAGIGAGMLLGGMIGQAYGWRVALITAGIPGIVLAVLFRLTVREPARGGSERSAGAGADAVATAPIPIGRALRTLGRSRSFRWLVLGASLSQVTSIGRGAWEPVFLMRVYEMDQAVAGLAYFLIGPAPSMLGATLGGLAADRMGKRDARWYMWLPAITTFVSFPLMAAFLLWPEQSTLFGGAVPIAFAFSVLGSIAGAMASPATIATGQSLASPSMRALSHAIWTMAANLVGMGLGPLMAGMLSEAFAPDYGEKSIRYALLVISAVAIPAALALFLGARSIREDFARAGSMPAPS